MDSRSLQKVEGRESIDDGTHDEHSCCALRTEVISSILDRTRRRGKRGWRLLLQTRLEAYKKRQSVGRETTFFVFSIHRGVSWKKKKSGEGKNNASHVGVSIE